MGFFGKIKQNMHRGGVKVQLQAPAGIHITDASMPITVTVTATDLPAHINSVAVKIQGSRMINPNDNRNLAPTSVDFAAAASNQPFDLQPGQSQTIQINLTIDQTAGANDLAGKAEHLLHGLAQGAMTGDMTYMVIATADVEGIAMDPMAQQVLQIWQVGQTGFAKNF